MIEFLENKKKLVSTRIKEELTKNCFWIPEKTPVINSNKSSKPKHSLFCPCGINNHTIKLKDLINLRMKKDTSGTK